MRTITTFIALLIGLVSFAQLPTVHNGEVRLKETPQAQSTDSILAIKPDGTVAKTGLKLSDLSFDLEGYRESGTNSGNDLSLSLGYSSFPFFYYRRIGGNYRIDILDSDAPFVLETSSVSLQAAETNVYLDAQDDKIINIADEFWLTDRSALGANNKTAIFKIDNISNTKRTFQMPDESGTVALTSDIPEPYQLYKERTGFPSRQVEIGDFDDNGNGTNITINDQSQTIYLEGSRINFKSINSLNDAYLRIDSLTQQRNYQFPDESGMLGLTRQFHTYPEGDVISEQFGGNLIGTALGLPEGAVKGMARTYTGSGGGDYANTRLFDYMGDFEAVGGQKNFSYTQGIQSLDGQAYGLGFYHPLVQDEEDNFQVKLKAKNSNGDFSYAHFNSLGYKSEIPIPGKDQEAMLDFTVQNNELENSSLVQTPHYLEYNQLVKLTGYGSGDFIEGYTHRDDVSRTGTAATTIGNAEYLAGFDADSNLMEIDVDDFATSSQGDLADTALQPETHLKNVYTQIGGLSADDWGMNGFYDRSVLTDADLRGSITVNLTGSGGYPTSTIPKMVNAKSDYFQINDLDATSEIDIIIDNGYTVENNSDATWQPFYQRRRGDNAYGRFRHIKVYVSEDNSTWITNSGWEITDFGDTFPAGDIPGLWFGEPGVPNTPSTISDYRYVKFELRDYVVGSVNDRNYIVQLGMRHRAEQVAQQYVKKRDLIDVDETSNFTLNRGHNGKTIFVDSASPRTVTIPENLPKGFNCTIIDVTLNGVTFSTSGTASLINSAGVFGRYTVYKRSSDNSFYIDGN